MAGRDLCRAKLIAVLLFLFLLVPLNYESVYGQCASKSTNEMWSFLVDLPNYTRIETRMHDRFAKGTFLAHVYETTYVKRYESVGIKLLDYDDEASAASDVTVFPTSTDSNDWKEITFRGHPAYERTTEITSSEYLDYTVDLRVVDGCTVVRGLWHEKIRIYDQLVTLEEGKASVEKVVGAIVDEIDGRTPTGIEPPKVNATSSETSKPTIVVLANSIDYSLATVFFGFLENRGIDVIHATAVDFDLYKDKRFIVILGGPEAPEGVGEIVQGVLTEIQENSVREAEARRRYTKTNVWAQDQRVTVIAGSDRHDTMKSHEENREDIAFEATEDTQ